MLIFVKEFLNSEIFSLFEVENTAIQTADALTSAIKKRTSTVSNKAENVVVAEKVERSLALKDMLKTQKSVFDDE